MDGRARGWLAGRARQLRWLTKTGLALRHPEYFLDRLGLSRLVWGRHQGPGRLVRGPVEFTRAEYHPLIDPPFVTAADADHMRPEDVILGVKVEGDARAYPWWIMFKRHIANDTVGGRPLLVMVCALCSTGVAFDPVIDGRRFTFEGRHFYNGLPALDDHQTGSVWSPVLGVAIRGRMAGTTLPGLPLWQMAWSGWRDLYPHTRVLAGHLGRRRTGHESQHSIPTPQVNRRMARLLARWDTRLPHNTLVLGVITENRQRAYSLDMLRGRQGVVCDELGGQPIVVLLHMAEGSYATVAYSRVVDGRVLTFDAGPRGPTDAETGSLWTAQGRAVAGPLAGTALAFVNSHVAQWFIWAAHYPEIDIYGQEPGAAG